MPNKQLYKRFKEEHKCVSCGRKLNKKQKRVKCEKCTETNNRYNNRVRLKKINKYQIRKHLHKCADCEIKLEKGYIFTRCIKCLGKRAIYDKERYDLKRKLSREDEPYIKEWKENIKDDIDIRKQYEQELNESRKTEKKTRFNFSLYIFNIILSAISFSFAVISIDIKDFWAMGLWLVFTISLFFTLKQDKLFEARYE